MIFREKKKDNNFYSLLHEIESEQVLNRKFHLDNRFYKMVCESDDLEAVRKSIKTFYETQRLLPSENKQEINIQNNISVPVSVKDIRPDDIDQ